MPLYVYMQFAFARALSRLYEMQSQVREQFKLKRCNSGAQSCNQEVYLNLSQPRVYWKDVFPQLEVHLMYIEDQVYTSIWQACTKFQCMVEGLDANEAYLAYIRNWRETTLENWKRKHSS
eukprot:1152565-Pelagomonas_calceolata.AAC.2